MTGIAIKRCTLIVQDVRRGAAFYRDTLGLKQTHESFPTLSGNIVPAGLPDAHAHLVVMQTGPLELGLLQWTDPPLAKPEDPYPIHLGIGEAAIEIDAADFDAIHARLKRAHEARLHEPAKSDEIGFFDSDGFFLTVHKALPDQARRARVTLIVRDLAVSQPFYCETLGMGVVTDLTGVRETALLPAGVPGALARSVVLNAGDLTLELLCFIDPALDAPDEPRHHLGIGDAIIVAETADLRAVRAGLENSEGRLHIGAADSKSSLSFFDPDGHFFELNSLRSA